MIPKEKAEKAIRRIKSKTCPFCGQKEFYAYAPNPVRNWWVVGCQSIKCDSSWRIEKDRLEQVEELLEKANKLSVAARAAVPEVVSIWVYTVNDGKVTHERSFPDSCEREAKSRVKELLKRGVTAFCSRTFIKDAYA